MASLQSFGFGFILACLLFVFAALYTKAQAAEEERKKVLDELSAALAAKTAREAELLAEIMAGQLTGHCEKPLQHGIHVAGLAVVGGKLVSGGINGACACGTCTLDNMWRSRQATLKVLPPSLVGVLPLRRTMLRLRQCGTLPRPSASVSCRGTLGTSTAWRHSLVTLWPRGGAMT